MNPGVWPASVSSSIAGQTPGFTGGLPPELRGAAAAGRPPGQARDRPPPAGGGDHARDRGPGEEDPRDGGEERRITHYREMGHALVGPLPREHQPVHKISVISRGQALGCTISLPTEDKFLTTRAELSDTMATTLGGRAAEEIVFSEVATSTAAASRRSPPLPSRWSCASACRTSRAAVFGRDHGRRSWAASSPPNLTTRTRSPARSTPRCGASLRTPVGPRPADPGGHREKLDRSPRSSSQGETIECEQFVEAARRQARGRGLRTRGTVRCRCRRPRRLRCRRDEHRAVGRGCGLTCWRHGRVAAVRLRVPRDADLSRLCRSWSLAADGLALTRSTLAGARSRAHSH